VRKYLPEMPDYGRPLTIRHLLNHTSGLRDAFLILELSAPEDGYGDRNDVILKQLARQGSLNYKPGTEFLYNNGGYVLAAITASAPTLSGSRSSSLRSPCCNTDDIGAMQLTQRIADVYAPAPPTEDLREGDAEQQDAGEAVHELCPGLRSEVISHSPDTWFDYEVRNTQRCLCSAGPRAGGLES